MSQQTINVGASPNDGTGTPLRTAFQYTNSNFSELYTALGGGSGLPGATTQVIFNDGGTNLAGDAGLVYNKTTDALTIGGNVQAASGTITGDLTVDTSTLKVDSANDRVGIGTASPAALLEVYKNTNGQNRLFINNPSTGSSAYASIDFTTGSISNQILSMGSGYSGAFPYTTNALVLRGPNSGGIVLNTSSSGPIVFGINDSPALTLNSSGNLGLGVTPSAWGSNWKASHVGIVGSFASSGAGSAPPTAMVLGAYNDNTNWKYQFASTGAARYEMTGANAGSAHAWYIAPGGSINANIAFTQAMTLDASGALLVGTAVAPNVGAATTSSGFSINGSGNNAYIASKIDNGTCGYFRRDGTDGAVLNFYKANSAVGNISVTASACTFNSTSDYRLKESVQPLVGGLARISALKPSTYKWKVDGSNGEGFIAHELAEVVPAAVTGEKDALNADGSIKPQGVDLSKVVPVLVAAIQELTARVQTLETP